MFSIVGGTYKGVNYSAMYHSSDKYLVMSPNLKYYLHPGNIDDEHGNPTDKYGMLVFDIDTDELVYGEETDIASVPEESYYDYLYRKAEELFQKLDWLRE